MRLDRRLVLKLAAALGVTSGFRIIGANVAHADDVQWRHGLSLFGDLKYPPDFKHFEYVNPEAPKGGRVRLYGIGSFDSLNPYTYKGSAAGLISFTSDSLMTSSMDEPSTEYGLVAALVAHPEDFSTVTYRLRPEARFQDGKPITVEDVIWSMEALKKSHPQYAFYYQNVAKAEQTGDHDVTFVFTAKGNRELPQIVGQLPVLARQWWTGKDEAGRQRNIEETTLSEPIGSGGYRISRVDRGREISVQRIPEYWGKDLPVNVGTNNFDEISLTYFRDQSVALEAFKSDNYDWRTESTAKDWATGYDFPAVKKGEVILEKFTNKIGEGMQAFVFNTRRAKFADPRVRLAFSYAFDFEWSNANLFYGEYVRTQSFFSASELAATSLPSAEEIAILEPLRGQIPPEVFTDLYAAPVNATPQDRRNNLRTAARLMNEAGWTVGGNRVLQNDKGEPFEVEFLLVQPNFERIVLPYVQQLELIGVKSRVRIVDTAQYERRIQNFDFDIVVGSWGQSLSPGNEQRDYWGTEAADRLGSRNLVGIKNPAIDALIERVVYATSRKDLVAATRALDRVLLWNHYVVPMWHAPYDRTARWNRFGHPEKLPDYAGAGGFPTIWWWDAEKASKISRA